MADVARLADVSPMTVSRVLSGHRSVRPETRAKVLQAIEQLDYTVHQAARRLASGRSHSIGIISIGPLLYGPSSTLSGIEAAARQAGHMVNVALLHQNDEAGLRQALGTLRAAQVDGFVVIAPVRPTLRALARLDVPEPVVVLYGGRAGGWNAVGVDQRAGARVATAHLLGLGHQVVHHLRGPIGWIEADRREAGWRAALAEEGIVVPAPVAGDWSPASGYEMGRRLAKRVEVTAVFVANDQMAIGLLLALADAGRAVPGEVSVVGFDDIPESEFTIPPLTTVRQDFVDLGQRAVERLIGAIEGTTTGQPPWPTPTLVVRRSAAAPPIRRRGRSVPPTSRSPK